MSTQSLNKLRTSKNAAANKSSAKSTRPSKVKITAAAAPPKKPQKAPMEAADRKVERVTKQERVLTLLGRSEGASVEEMMQATGWQQHSVRGFLAGTVKKKLGFPLTSSKGKDDVRRYRIEKRRGRSDA
jgi:hypothetical protein